MNYLFNPVLDWIIWYYIMQRDVSSSPNYFPAKLLREIEPYFSGNQKGNIGEILLPTESSTCFVGIYPEIFFIMALSLLLIFLVILDYVLNFKIILSTVAANLFVLILILVGFLINNNYTNFYIFDNLLIYDPFINFVQNILIFSLICCILISYSYVKYEKIVNYEYYILLGLSFLGLITITMSNDLITMYLGIELQSLAFYILAATKIHSNYSTEAGLKYFILGALASGFLLFGSSLIYGFTGTTNFSDLHLLFFDNNIPNNLFGGILLGGIFVTVGILFKLGAVPFHMWVPDVYDGVPTSITAVFAIIPKIAIFALFLHLSKDFFLSNYFFWHQIIVYSALLSITVGTLGALYQTKIKRLLAYSAISHVGFLIIGFATLTNFGLFATFFYLIVYILISLNLFSILLSLRKQNNFLKLKKINEISILFKSNKLLAINLAIILFSIAGIPPLVGFYSKFYIFVSAIKTDVYLVALLAAIFSVVASMYYIRLIKLMFFKNFDYWTFFVNMSKLNSYIISGTFFFNIFFFCYPEVIVRTIFNIILTVF